MDFCHDLIMTGINLQIRIPPELDRQLKKLAPKSKSAFVREAIEEKVRRETERRMEEHWIAALKKNPDQSEFDEDWHHAQFRGEE